MSLRLPKCEFCKHFIEDEEKYPICKAFPDGVPDSINVFDWDSRECTAEYQFTPDEDEVWTSDGPEEGGMLSRMLKI